ncbi:MAG: tetratricopeptide repeat protein [Planctomycetota bacterium]
MSRLRQIEELFNQALDRPPAERERFLTSACPDAEMRREVLALIARDAADEASTLQGPRIVAASTAGHDPRFAATLSNVEAPAAGTNYGPGDRIGPYELLEVLGEGGMGTVFRALQEQPLRRTVALKVIKLGMDSRDVLARFDAERQALARMSHAHVAKVLDAGTTESGRPYFAMELVEGVSITHYCDRHNLSTADRLELFIPVCEAIQHAHHKGIIHRDIKPSNVLVTIRDGRPEPVVIDFGIAKAIHTPLTERTLQTAAQFLGTPEYMSPEQASMAAVDVDTRTDIYSLGVLLYELLTGTTPFDSRELRKAGLLEIHRIIREVEPPKPSTRLSTLGPSAETHARQRQTHAGSLGRSMRGDLDWIVMKCLEKEPERRYGSPSELALDVGRHLKLEPVLASPPSALYRARKFVRKNRLPVAAAAAVFISLTVGLAASLALYFEARAARREAEISEQRATREAEVARAEADKAMAIQGFVSSMLASSDPDLLGNDAKVSTVLARARSDLESSFATQPAVRAALSDTLGMSFYKLGQVEDAETLLRAALAGADPRDRLRAATHLATVLAFRGRLNEAETTIQDARAAAAAETPARDRHWADIQWAAIVADLGRMPAALAAMSRGIDGLLHELGPTDLDVFAARRIEASLLEQSGQLEAAANTLERTLKIAEDAGLESHTRVLLVRNNLANARVLQGRYRDAQRLLEDTLARRVQILGPDHVDVYETLQNLAHACQKLGALRRAGELFERAQAGFAEALGEGHSRTLQVMNNRALLLLEQNELALAEPLARRVVELRATTEGFEREQLSARHTLAEILHRAGRGQEAFALYESVVEEALRTIPDDRLRVAIYRGTYGRALLDAKRYDDAERELLASAESLYDQLGESHEYTQAALHVLSRLYANTGRLRDALGLRQRLEGRAKAD